MPYYGVFAPKGVPEAFVSEFGAAMNKVLARPPVREQMQRMGLAPGHMTAQQLGSGSGVHGDVGADHPREGVGASDGARVSLQVDIGFGDTVTPAPGAVTYPVLIEGLPAPRLRGLPEIHCHR